MASGSSEARLFPSTSSQSALSSSSTDLTMTPTSTPPRPSLSTSLSDFALSSSSSSSSAVDDSMQSKDDTTPLLKRIRRPTIHSLWLGLDQRVNSPLANTFTLPPSRTGLKGKERCVDGDGDGEDLEGGFRDKDRMTTGSSSPSSESDFTTPPMRLDNPRMEELAERPKSSPMDISRSASPASALKPPADIQDAPGPSQTFSRRLSHPPKPARLLSLRAEAHPDDIEVKHEAQVQRLLASFSGLPPGLGPTRSSRSASNRGRYPEEAVEDEEFQREETPSDDGEAEGDAPSAMFSYKVPTSSDPINITKPSTPVPSVLGTPEDSQGGFRGISESPSNIMDIDMPMYAIGSPAMPPVVIPPQQWRQTPPPTSASSAVRTAKRKYEDRFEPYAPSAKRRAVSPSISHLKERDLVSPIIIPRSPILKPRKSFSQSQANSTTSSPTISNSSNYLYGNGGPYPLPLPGNGHHRSSSSSSVVSSPTVRASMILASPILRPVPRLAAGLKRVGDEEKIVDGAGENLKELNIGRN